MRKLPYIVVVSLCIVAGCVSSTGRHATAEPVSSPAQPPEEHVPPAEPVPEASIPEEQPATTVPEIPKTGGLNLMFFDTEGGTPMPVDYTLFPSDHPESPAAEGRGSSAVLTMKPGNYNLTVSWETGTRGFEGISVEADRLKERPIILDAGTLLLRFLDIPDGDLSEASYSMYYHENPDLPIAEGVQAEASMLLAEGLYDLCLHRQGGTAWSYGLSVMAGGASEYTIFLSKSTLNLHFTDPSTGAPAWAEYRIYPAGKWENILIWDDGEDVTAHLDSGSYDIYYAWEQGEGWIRNIRAEEGSITTMGIPLK